MRPLLKWIRVYYLPIVMLLSLNACDKSEDLRLEDDGGVMVEAELTPEEILHPVVGQTVRYPNPPEGGEAFVLPDAMRGLTIHDFPVMDGSDSTQPLRTLLWCRLLGYEAVKWERVPTMATYYIRPAAQGNNKDEFEELYRKANQNWNTHLSFLNLIDDKVDIIITARGISRDEKAYAKEQRVELIESPIAKDAFIFMVNYNNPVGNLSIQQIRDIYTGKLTNWKNVGGKDAVILPYIRNANSGSQEKMETIVMKGLTMIDWPEMMGMSMGSPYVSIVRDEHGIAYTPYYYYRYIARDPQCRVIGIEGVAPTRETIANGTYPYVTEVMAAIRADEPRDSYASRLFELLTQGGADSIISESGYIPYN